MIVSLAALLAATTAGCTPVPGTDELWLPQTRWVIVGEMHGTMETPDAFTNLVCLAALKGRPVTVALEYSVDWQAVLDAYLLSDGRSKARAALLTLPVWHTTMPDGRGSVAFLAMLDRLRKLKQAGKITGLVASDVGKYPVSGQTRDAAIAKNWTAIQTADDGIVLALVGNVHTMRKAMVRAERTIVTAGSLMPPTRTITINVTGNGGKAWNCQADGCREHDNGSPRTVATGIVYSNHTDYPWTATYELGRPTTSAAPAIAGTPPASSPTVVHIGN